VARTETANAIVEADAGRDFYLGQVIRGALSVAGDLIGRPLVSADDRDVRHREREEQQEASSEE
jgi:hypothetical protein